METPRGISVRNRLLHWLRAQVRSAVEARDEQQSRLHAEWVGLEVVLGSFEARLIGADRSLQGVVADLTLLDAPFCAELTVDQAWRKHPGTQAVFARHHLPSCDGCAVRFDETLDEAATAYGLDLAMLLEELNALL